MLSLKPQQVVKLHKGAYGLEQAPRLWYESLIEFLTDKLNFKPKRFDPCPLVQHLSCLLYTIDASQELTLYGSGDVGVFAYNID